MPQASAAFATAIAPDMSHPDDHLKHDCANTFFCFSFDGRSRIT
jgi:hypothetical protein